MTSACINSVFNQALTYHLSFCQTDETKRYPCFVRAANNALKVLSKVTDDNFKDLPSEAEKAIFVANHPHGTPIRSGGTQSHRKPDIVVTTVREAARTVSPLQPRSWESISKGAPFGGESFRLDSFRGILSCLEFKLEGSGMRVQDISNVDEMTPSDPMSIIGEEKAVEGVVDLSEPAFNRPSTSRAVKRPCVTQPTWQNMPPQDGPRSSRKRSDAGEMLSLSRHHVLNSCTVGKSLYPG
jgi:hypothetical protein